MVTRFTSKGGSLVSNVVGLCGGSLFLCTRNSSVSGVCGRVVTRPSAFVGESLF